MRSWPVDGPRVDRQAERCGTAAPARRRRTGPTGAARRGPAPRCDSTASGQELRSNTSWPVGGPGPSSRTRSRVAASKLEISTRSSRPAAARPARSATTASTTSRCGTWSPPRSPGLFLISMFTPMPGAGSSAAVSRASQQRHRGRPFDGRGVPHRSPIGVLGIVVDDQPAVGRQAHVELHPVRTLFMRAQEGRPRVLRVVGRRPPVGDDERDPARRTCSRNFSFTHEWSTVPWFVHGFTSSQRPRGERRNRESDLKPASDAAACASQPSHGGHRGADLEPQPDIATDDWRARRLS